MDLWVGLDRSWWVEGAIAYLLAACLCASRLRNLIIIVLKAEEVWHVVRGYLLLASAAYRVLMDHGLALVQIATHVHTLNVNRLGHAVRLIVEIRVIRHIIARFDVDLEKLSSLCRWS